MICMYVIPYLMSVCQCVCGWFELGVTASVQPLAPGPAKAV